MSILITIGVVVCGIVLLLERKDSRRLDWRGYNEITLLDIWKARRR